MGEASSPVLELAAPGLRADPGNCRKSQHDPDLAQVAAGRSQVYGLLRDAFNQLPSAGQLTNLVSNPLLDAAVLGDRAGQDALVAVRRAFAAAGHDTSVTIAVERTRLLRGLKPGQGCPAACESVYLPCTVVDGEEAGIGRAWATLIECYRGAGFIPEPNLPPDYIGIEIGFLAHASAREAQAWQCDDSSGALAAAARQLEFLRTHIGRWIGPLVERVGDENASAFWPNLLALAAAYLRQDDEYLTQVCEAGAADLAGCESASAK
jgi:TorA maturation chaperone TorD